MAHLTANDYSSYDLNIQEYEEGSKFTVTQKQVIQNHIAILAQELITLEPDPTDYAKFIQQQAHTKGGIDALRYLLSCGEAVEQVEQEAADLRPEVTENAPSNNPYQTFQTNQE